MGKSRISVRLKDKVRGSKSHNKSEDLALITEKYNAFCKRLQGLINALLNQHAAMQQLAKARFEAAQHLAVMSKDTVLYETTGQTSGADRSSDSVTSYFSIQEEVANKTKMYTEKYKQFVVDYAQEWYKVVTDRVGADLKKADKIRVELDHYQSKVENLRQSANATMAKGKKVDSKTAEKLTRNEDKLIKIKEASSKFISVLCLLMEEVTERSWRDLHPMLVKCAQFEAQVSGDDARAFESMNEVIAALKKVASDHGIKPQTRLKDLQTVDPNILSTRSKDDSRNLAIENGFAGMALGRNSGSSISGGSVTGGSVTGSAFGGGDDAMHFPPGSTHAQGLGGFPVRVQSGDMSNELGQSSASTSGPSTMSMMNINAAPAPTMDTMAQAFGSGASAAASSSAPNSGGIPYNGMDRSRNYSANSLHSGHFSGEPAPPPCAAPPPPPPSMGGSMGGGYNSFGGPGPNQTNSNPFGAPPPGPIPPSMGMQNNYPQQGVHPQAGNFAQQHYMSGGNNPQQQSMHGGQQQQHQQQQHNQYNAGMPAPVSYGVSNSINTNPFG